MMKNIVLTLSFLLFGVNVWGQDSILFNHIFEKAPQLPLPFYKKGNTSLKKENQIDTTIMKKFFDIKDFKYDITSFDYETESLEFVDYSIMKVWVDNSWTFRKFKCFVLSSWKDALDGLYDEKFLYFSVLSEKGTLIDKLIFDEHDEEGKIVKRSGAKDTDLICVTGDLGAAYMGLLLLEREKEVFNAGKGSDPDFAGKEYLVERQLKPRARKDIIESLERINVVPTAMMDISDGLSSELLHICKASHVGCRIYEDRIPIDFLTAQMAEEMNMNMTMAAMNGGEDYELLFTIPLSMHDTFTALTEVALPGVPRPDIKIIGHITSENLGARMITRGGGEIDIQAQGWNSLKK